MALRLFTKIMIGPPRVGAMLSTNIVTGPPLISTTTVLGPPGLGAQMTAPVLGLTFSDPGLGGGTKMQKKR